MRTRDKDMLKRYVEQGVDFLNSNPEAFPEFDSWYSRIKINNLRMADYTSCIIGQLMGGYGSGITEIANRNGYIKDKTDEGKTRWAIRHGFLASTRIKRQKLDQKELDWRASLGLTYIKYDEYEDEMWTNDVYAYLDMLWRDAILNEQLKRSLAKVEQDAEVELEA